jgi:hypothetical protein
MIETIIQFIDENLFRVTAGGNHKNTAPSTIDAANITWFAVF